MADNGTAAQKVRGVGEALLRRGEEIYEVGGLSPAIWEELVQKDLLGRMAPSVAVARAIVAQIRNMEDQILWDIIMGSVIEQDCRDSTTSGSVLREGRKDMEGARMAAPIEAKARVTYLLD